MSDERKPDDRARKELLSHNVDERVRRFRRRGRLFGVVGVGLLGLATVASSPISVGLGTVGALCIFLSWRLRSVLSAVGEIRAATEAAGRVDHVELERRLRAQLAGAHTAAMKLSVLELLGNSLWRRGAVRELAEVFHKHLGGAGLGDAGRFGEWYAKAHAYALLADACTGQLDSIESRAQRIEAADVPDARAFARVALARAVAALRSSDAPAALRALEGFEHKSLDASAEDRALARALRAYATRAPSAGGEAYRAGSTAASGGTMRAWVEQVFAPAAPFVDEPPLLERDDPPWNAAPIAAPTFATPAREGKRPLRSAQLATLAGGWVIAVASMLLMTTATADYALGGLLLALASWGASLAIVLVRASRARRDTRALRRASALRIAGRFEAMREVLPTGARDPVASASALLMQTHVEMSRGAIAEALACVDRALGRLAWLREQGRETLPWANAVLMRPALLAMLGREDEAERALAFASMSVIESSNGRGLRFAVRLWTALALGRREEAIEIARTFDARTPIDGRTELARDALLSLSDPAARLRLRARVESWPQARVVLEKVCPWLTEAWRAPEESGVRVDLANGEIPQSDPAESRSAPGEGDAQGRGGSTP